MNANDPLNDLTSGEAKTSLTFTDEPSKQNWTIRESSPLLSVPNTYTSFHDGSKEILRITREGRLEKGPHLSDDEVSVRLFEICKNTFGGKMKELEDQLEKTLKDTARLDWLERHALAQHSTYVSISDLGAHYNGFPGSFRAAVDRAIHKEEISK